MNIAQVEAEARGTYERGDAIGALRLFRDFLQTRPNATDAGRAHTAIAELYIQVGTCSTMRIRDELAQARELLADSREHLPVALLTSMLAACSENNEAEAACWHRAYTDLCRKNPSVVAVTRWRGRFTHLLGQLDRARGAHAHAIAHYQQAMAEYRRYEPNRREAQQWSRMADSWIAWHLLQLKEVEEARLHLDSCDGPVFSSAWEAVRACFEVEYHVAAGNLDRAQFWLSLARQWSNPSAEAAVRTLYCQALLARARGHRTRAAELAMATRSLAASLKQDYLLSETRQFAQSLREPAVPAASTSD